MAASYPTSAKTFTVKNATDTIQASHINDLQDEVTAVEQGLLGGVSPLSCSNFSAASLSAAGSTVTTLQVNGHSTITGTLTVNKIVSTSIQTIAATSFVHAFVGGVQALSSGASTTAVALSQEVADLLGEFDSTTYTFTPQSSGYYLVTGRTTHPAFAGRVGLSLKVNSSLAAQQFLAAQAASTLTPTVTAVLHLSTGAAGAVTMNAVMTADSSTSQISTGVGVSELRILKVF